MKAKAKVRRSCVEINGLHFGVSHRCFRLKFLRACVRSNGMPGRVNITSLAVGHLSYRLASLLPVDTVRTAARTEGKPGRSTAANHELCHTPLHGRKARAAAAVGGIASRGAKRGAGGVPVPVVRRGRQSVRFSFSNRNLRSKMPSGFTRLFRLTRCHACDPIACMWAVFLMPPPI